MWCVLHAITALHAYSQTVPLKAFKQPIMVSIRGSGRMYHSPLAPPTVAGYTLPVILKVTVAQPWIFAISRWLAVRVCNQHHPRSGVTFPGNFSTAPPAVSQPRFPRAIHESSRQVCAIAICVPAMPSSGIPVRPDGCSARLGAPSGAWQRRNSITTGSSALPCQRRELVTDNFSSARSNGISPLFIYSISPRIERRRFWVRSARATSAGKY